MSLKAKIILTGINVAFLIVALMYPDNTTPLATLIAVISAISWTLSSDMDKIVPRSILFTYIGVSSLLSVICIVLGFTGEISLKSPGVYKYAFYNDVAVLGGLEFDYFYFALMAGVAVIVLMLAELYAAFVKEKLNQNMMEGKKIWLVIL